MVCPKGYKILCQAALDAIFKHPDYPLYLPVGFAVANSDMVVDDAQLLAEPCKAARKLSINICPDVSLLAPIGN